ncbi:MAG TPA: YtxH domain-containing protein [Haliscomenobacter sp.]|uniref:YtxH domain-containing protein n=1 Tax=Haliscomenobacter sp. TaxID=2717303 RepID=UPI002CC72C77|nr:YtxH domain-containing protein [Haliscomenobacter sp.]HOY20973.1 YtxH domain-containing protein [Haliscomenobacter sp.]
MNTRRIAWGVAAGVAVGSAVAALYGTKKGAELRKKIAEFTSQYPGGVGSTITGIVTSLYSAFGNTEEKSNTRTENKNGHTPDEEGRKKLALPST